MRFRNKTAFITGGAVGLGRAFARALSAEGASVAIAEIETGGAEATAAELVAGGTRAIAVRCDVADEHQVDAAVAVAIEKFGGIDILINNAAIHLLKYNDHGCRQLHSGMPQFDAGARRRRGAEHGIDDRLFK